MARRHSKRPSNLHFKTRPKRRFPLKAAAILFVLLVVAFGALSLRAVTMAVPRVRAASPRPLVVPLAGAAPAPLWPAQGEGAVEIQGLSPIDHSPNGTPVPIASLAKMMTAYVVLADHPLRPGQDGFSVTIGARDVADYNRRLAQAESVVPVATGETLDETELLQALLVASGNNVATILADFDAGSAAAFVAKMNTTAQQLGMADTRYTDPSGVAATTVSTAADQLVLADKAMSDPVFAQTVAMTSVTLPVAGTLANFDRATGTGGYIGIKTGSDEAAGGCLVFANRRTVAGHAVTVLGAVLGQDRGTSSTPALIGAAVQAANRLVGSVVASVGVRTAVPAGTTVATLVDAQGRRTEVRTSAPLDLFGWGGMPVHVEVDMGPLGTGVAAGARLATVSLQEDPSVRVAAVAATALPAPTFTWRLRHAL